MVTVGDVMRHLRHFFAVDAVDADFTVASGAVTPDLMLLEGEWVAVRTPAGVDILCAGEGGTLPLPDGSFTGTVWYLRPPDDFLRLCADIAGWDAAHPADGVVRERFGEYERVRASGPDGLPQDWRTVFAARLLPWRRMFPEVSA